MKHLTATLCLTFSIFIIGSVNAQMYEKDGIMLNSAGGNIFGDSSFNPMADPSFNPMGDAYIRNDGTMGLRSED